MGLRAEMLVVLATFVAYAGTGTVDEPRALTAPTRAGMVRDGVPQTYPITKPARRFVPPPPYRRDHGGDQFWYRTESLWTLLGVSGAWNIRGNVLERKYACRTKLIYWRRGFDWWKDKPELTVVAKRLDREAPIVAVDRANAVFVTTDKPAMMTEVHIPSFGCWKITAQYHGHELSFCCIGPTLSLSMALLLLFPASPLSRNRKFPSILAISVFE